MAEPSRALLWSHVVAYDAAREAWSPVAEAGWDHEEFAIYVRRSVRQKGGTKTVKSRHSVRGRERHRAQRTTRLPQGGRGGGLTGREWSPCELRHSFVSVLSVSGRRAHRDLMQRMGHDSVRAALIYQHGTAEADRKIADAMNDEIAKADSDDDDGSSGALARVG